MDELLASLKAKAILLEGVAYSLADPITIFAKTLFTIFKTKSWKQLNNLGVNMLKNEDGLYTFVYNGTKLAKKLSKTEAETFLKNSFTKLKSKTDDVVKTYLDELAKSVNLRKAALARYANKFDNFFRHFDGEILIRSKKGKEYFELQGAHNYLVNGKKIRIGTIRKPPGIKLDDIPNDVPFIANVEMKYANRYLPKKSTSSFFPKN